MHCSVTTLTLSVFSTWILLSFLWFINYRKSIITSVMLESIITEEAGEFGAPVILYTDSLNKETLNKIQLGLDRYGYNSFVSDIISVHRSLPQVYPPNCPTLEENLPQTSVIITFHNEHYSVLLRTIHSVLNNSPSHLLKEIVLVDDFSSDVMLQKDLDTYWIKEPKVKIIHLNQRNGLAKSRMFGVQASTAEVLTFLDSNCECPLGWLPPLLKEIKNNPNTIASPVLDVIDSNTFEYQVTKKIFAGGFNWNLKFKWLEIPSKNDNIEPVPVPVLPGGIFSISSSFFSTLEGFYEEFVYMGGEIFEVSFKGWMCGGLLKIIPCSHVGHVFRTKIPEDLLPDEVFLQKNLQRVAAGWMDDFAGYFYERRHDLQRSKRIDVSKSIELRKKLNCRSFEWYLNNVYPDLYVPSDCKLRGQLRNWSFNLCMKADINPYNIFNYVTLDEYCRKGEDSFWLITPDGHIRQDDFCLDQDGNQVFLKLCSNNDDLQLWDFDEKEQMIRSKTNFKMCLGVYLDTDKNERVVGVKECGDKYLGGTWIIELFF